jgi:archaellum component FlaC
MTIKTVYIKFTGYTGYGPRYEDPSYLCKSPQMMGFAPKLVDIDALNNSIDQLKLTNTNLLSQITTLNETINQLKNDRQRIESSVNRIGQVNQGLTAEITEVKTNLGGIKEKIVDLGTKISGLLTFVPNLVQKTRDYFMDIVSHVKTGNIESVNHSMLTEKIDVNFRTFACSFVPAQPYMSITESE